MIMQKYKEKRVLYRDSLRNLCIEKQWYTRGDCAEYEKLLSMTGDGEKHITTNDIVEIAENIMKHTDEPERSLESYCFEIARITYTFFEAESENDSHRIANKIASLID
ncbi:MAG: hypothetical protein K2N95_06185 [Lachnospiraceae bacterium]|nr:hypothetical protein [Lachnospiraceae bacterium]